MTEPTLPLRFTCVWEGDSAGVTPGAFLSAVVRATGLSPTALPTQSSSEGLSRVSLYVPAAPPTTREQRAAWTRALEHDVDSEGLAVATTAGAMAQHGPALVVLDGDSTLFTGEGIDLVAAHAGTQAEVAAITAAAMRGELDFAQSLRRRMGTLRGLPVSVLDQVRQDYHFSPGAAQMVSAFHRRGVKVGVVSGGFRELVAPHAAKIGLDFVKANCFEVDNGQLTGEPEGNIVTAETKETCLRSWAAELGIGVENCVAMGDGANDLKMVRAAGLGVAYLAKPALQAAADVRLSWPNLAALSALTLPD